MICFLELSTKNGINLINNLIFRDCRIIPLFLAILIILHKDYFLSGLFVFILFINKQEYKHEN
jgi:hypothetical protein